MPAGGDVSMKLVYKGIEVINGKRYVRSTNLGILNPARAWGSFEFDKQINAIGSSWWQLAQFKEPFGTLESTLRQSWSYVAVVPAP